MLSNISRRFISNTKNTLSPASAYSLFEKSCYFKIDFKIHEEKNILEAVNRFTAFNIGCLAVTDNSNKVIGVLSEKDYITKVASLNKNNTDVKVKDICTYGDNVIIAKKNDSIDTCMHKLMFKNVRHLLVVDEHSNDVVGMISIKDVVREMQKKNNEIITRLSDFKIGKGAYFGSE